jgi:hypothetical protein
MNRNVLTVPSHNSDSSNLGWNAYIKVPIENVEVLSPEVFVFARDYLIARQDSPNYLIDPQRLSKILHVNKYLADALHTDEDEEHMTANHNFETYERVSRSQGPGGIVNYYSRFLKNRANVIVYLQELYRMWDKATHMSRRPAPGPAMQAYNILQTVQPYRHNSKNFSKPVYNSVAEALAAYSRGLQRTLPTNQLNDENDESQHLFLTPDDPSRHPIAQGFYGAYNNGNNNMDGGQISLGRKIRKIKHYNQRIKQLLATL